MSVALPRQVRRHVGHQARGLALALMVGALLLAAGCATVDPNSAPSAPPTSSATAGPGIAPTAAPRAPTDPWEGWNRRVFAFNDAVDEAVLAPVARAYRDVVPSFVRTGVANVFGNVGDAWSAGNHLLQGKLQSGVEQGMRFMVNTTFGLAGVLDVASEMGLTREREDFGQTLGRWGVGSGPYVVLPLLGPSTLRDTGGWLLDRRTTLPALVDDAGDSNRLTLLGVVQTRSELLSASRMLEQVALDRYVFVREGYLARRRNQVWDGNPPPEPDDEE